MAFDDDRSISDIHLKDESFLDINAHQFRKSLDLKWYDTLNGWRAAGGSVSTDRLFLNNELKIHKRISPIISFGMQYEQENFYAKKPPPQAMMSLTVTPPTLSNIGLSILGTPAYDKRQSDFGYAITVGQRPGSYSRLSALKVDKYYNDKNEFDASYYDEFGRSLRLDGAIHIKNGWQMVYDLKKETPLEFVFDNQTSRFRHESQDNKVNFIHHLSRKRFAGANFRVMNIDKYLEEASSNEGQKIDYYMLDLYWVDSGFDGNRELTAGFRYDSFKERLRDYLDPTNTYNFELTTWQAYSSLYNSYSLHQAWDLGLYLAWSERNKQYVINSSNEFDDQGVQAKLRTSWQYHSINKDSVLVITMTFNLDDLIDDPGDGGGIYFQSHF